MLWLSLFACNDSGPDSGASHPPDGEGITLGEIQACPEPVAPHWTDDTSRFAGHPDPQNEHHLGGYVAVDDLDGDGDQDVLLGFPNVVWDIWWNEGGVFSPTPWVGRETSWVPTLADVDGDGDRDVVMTQLKAPAELWLNDGGVFTPGSLETVEDRKSRELVALNLDDDGHLDLYVMADTGAAKSDDTNIEKRTDYALRSNAPASWNVGAGDYDHGRGFDAQVVDWDGDGDDDVMVADDEGWRYGGNRLFDNQDGELVDVSDQTGFYIEVAAMGLDVADFDGDRALDVYISAIGSSHLLQQLDGQFVDVTGPLAANPVQSEEEMGWGVLIRDLDNDGRPDLVTAQGDLWYEAKPGPDTVYQAPIDVLRQVEGGFLQSGPDWGFPTEGSYRSLVTWDENDDGVLDVLATDVVGAPHLLLSDGCSSGAWLSVDAPVGSRVEVLAGGRWYVKRATHASSFGGAGPATVHVGLGEADVEELWVTLPGGTQRYQADFEGRRSVRVE